MKIKLKNSAKKTKKALTDSKVSLIFYYRERLSNNIGGTEMDVIGYARHACARTLQLNAFSSPTEDALENISFEKAEQIIAEDPGLVFVSYPGAPIAWDEKIDAVITASFIVAEVSGDISFESWANNPDNSDFKCDTESMGGYEWADLSSDMEQEVITSFGFVPEDDLIEKAMLVISDQYLNEDAGFEPARCSHFVLGKLARKHECFLAQQRQSKIDAATRLTSREFLVRFIKNQSNIKEWFEKYPFGMPVYLLVIDPTVDVEWHPEIPNMLVCSGESFYITDHHNLSKRYDF
jgi:hypothetical protein